MSTWTDGEGTRVVNVHPETADCHRNGCCVHAPSPHPLVDWPTRFRENGSTERVCPCGVGHPDPDHLGFVQRRWGAEAAGTAAVHGCCGCCGLPAPPQTVVEVSWQEVRGALRSPQASVHGGRVESEDGWVQIGGAFTVEELGEALAQITVSGQAEDLEHTLPYWPHVQRVPWDARSDAGRG